MPIDITRKPISPLMLQKAAKTLWDFGRDEEGRVSWEEALPYVRSPYETRAILMLESALPQDKDFLESFAKKCMETAKLL